MSLLLRSAVHEAAPGATLRIQAEHQAGELRVTLSGASTSAPALDTALAVRIVRASGGRFVDSLDGVVMHLPLRRA